MIFPGPFTFNLCADAGTLPALARTSELAVSDFTLDTSGRVAGTLHDGLAVWYEFDDLDPFTQGYVEALFASLSPVAHRTRPKAKVNDGQIWLLKCGRGGFSRVTLHVPCSGHGSTATNYMCAGLIRRGWLEESRSGIVRITEAGQAALRTAMPLGFYDLAPETLDLIRRDCAARLAERPEFNGTDSGRYFWENRQLNKFRKRGVFPPQTPYLGDDGKVRLAAQVESPAPGGPHEP